MRMKDELEDTFQKLIPSIDIDVHGYAERIYNPAKDLRQCFFYKTS